MAIDDEDDWVGVPPEGHYTRDRADPAFWRSHWPVGVGGVAMIVVVAVLVIVALTR